MVEIRPRVNLYVFVPHPEWEGAAGAVLVSARDFQRAEGIALQEAGKRGVPGNTFSVLLDEASDQPPEGRWIEAERYRDVEDEERLVLFQFSVETAGECLEDAAWKPSQQSLI